MSLLSQIGIAILIITIILILIRSDKKLVEASREGEHFVDEWALREERKRQLIEEQKQRKDKAAAFSMGQESGGIKETDHNDDSWPQEDRSRVQDDSSWPRDNDSWPQEDSSWPRDDGSRVQEDRSWSQNNGSQSQDREKPQTCKERKIFNLTLVELNEARKPVRRVQVSKLPFYIGRDLSNDLVMDDLFVARRHCIIVDSPHGLMVEDRGSRNKVLADGCPAAEIYLRDGLILGIGNKELLVEMR